MGLSTKVGTFTVDTAVTVGNTQAITGVGFQPKVVIFFGSDLHDSDSIEVENIRPFFGAASGSGTANKAMAGISLNGLATSDNASGQYSQRCIAVYTNTSTVDGLAELTSLDADGFTLTIRDQFATAVRIHYLALGGTDITNVAVGSFAAGAATGDEAETGFGFQPDAVILWSNYNTVDSLTTQLRLGIGAGDASSQWAFAIETRDNQGTTSTSKYGKSGEIFAGINNNATTRRASLTSLDADGITLNWIETSGAVTINYLAIEGCGVKVGDLLTQTDTSTNITESGFGFQPAGIFLASVINAESAADTPNTSAMNLSMGAATGASARVAYAIEDEDNIADSITADAVEYDEIYIAIDAAQAVEGLMDLVSMDAGGFTCIMDDADPSQKFVGYIAFGPTPSGGTAYNQSVSGAATSAGVLARQTGKALSGAATPAGVAIKRTLKAVAGGVTPSGALARKITKALSGLVTPAGALTKRTGKALTGAIASAGSLLKQTGKAVAGAMTPAGAMAKRVNKTLSGAITSSGALARVKAMFVSLTGTLASAGALTKRIGKPVSGALSSGGALAKKTLKALTGTLASSGALSTLRSYLRTLTGAMTSSGALSRKANKATSGTLTSAGALIRQTGKTFTGTLTSSGTLVRQTAKDLAGALTSSGALIKRTAKTFVGVLTSVGTLVASSGGAVIAAIIRTWTLNKRDAIWTLSNRDTDLTLHERDTDWTLEDDIR